MIKFLSLGSGSSGNCYYLATGAEAIIIDVGVGVRSLKKCFRDYGLSMAGIHHILITHDHADHIRSVGNLSNEYHLPVYATEAVHKGIDRNYLVSRKVAVPLRRYVRHGEPFSIGSFRVTPFFVPHDASDNTGYFVEAGDVAFCLITDAGSVTDEMKSFIAKAQYLVMEANHDEEMLMGGPYPQFLKARIKSDTGHLSNNDCGKAIAENMSEDLRHVWLCHLSEENNHPELARKTVESTLRSYGIVTGKDLQLDVLKRTVPTGIFELE